PNNFQNFPVLSTVTVAGGMTTITGTLKSAPGSTFRVEFFASDTDPLGLPAEGQQFLGFVNTTTNANGNASFSTTVNVAVANGRIVTATATDAIGNTSEFSAAVVSRVAFALSSVDQQIYKEIFDVQGKALSAWTLTAPGKFTALAVGSVGADAAPMVFGLGV